MHAPALADTPSWKHAQSLISTMQSCGCLYVSMCTATAHTHKHPQLPRPTSVGTVQHTGVTARAVLLCVAGVRIKTLWWNCWCCTSQQACCSSWSPANLMIGLGFVLVPGHSGSPVSSITSSSTTQHGQVGEQGMRLMKPPWVSVPPKPYNLTDSP